MNTGIILAGGSASRMNGLEKPMLPLAGKPIIERVLDVLRPMFADIIVASGTSDSYEHLRGVETVRDERPGSGPLGGIKAGLEACRTPWAFVVAGDMPFLDPRLVGRIMSAALDSEANCVLPRYGTFVEPLHAAYRRAMLPDIDATLATGRRRILSAIQRGTPEWFDMDGEQLTSFYNVNCPSDLTGWSLGSGNTAEVFSGVCARYPDGP